MHVFEMRKGMYASSICCVHCTRLHFHFVSARALLVRVFFCACQHNAHFGIVLRAALFVVDSASVLL